MNELYNLINSLPNNVKVEGYGSGTYNEYYLKREFGEYMVWVGFDGVVYELGTYRKWAIDPNEEMSNMREVKTLKAVGNYIKKYL